MDRKMSARIAGMRSWEKSPEVKRANSRKGGDTVVERYGRSHMLKLAARSAEARKARAHERKLLRFPG